MNEYGRPVTVILCPKCKAELLGNGLHCAKCGPVIAYLARSTERTSAFDFTFDFVPIRLTFYLLMLMALLMVDGWHLYVAGLSLAMVIDPWRSVHQRVSWPRGLRYLTCTGIALGIASLQGLTFNELLDFDYSSISPTFSPIYSRAVLVVLAHAAAIAAAMMWIGALLMPRR